jgi:ribosomal protein S1
MPNCRCLDLPEFGERATGTVIWHADHNFQIKVQLRAWAEHPDHWLGFDETVGRTVTGKVTRVTPVGVFVRVAECIEGLIPQADLSLSGESNTMAQFDEGQQVRVCVVEVDLIRRNVRLALV